MSRITRMLETQNQTRTAKGTWKAPLAVALATGLSAVCLTTSMNSVDAAEAIVFEQDRGQKDDTSFPTAEAMRAKIGEEVRNGRMNREQAGQMMQLHRRLMMGIEDGKMSTREAQAMMNERGMAIFERGEGDDRRDRDDRGDSEDELENTIAQVERMLEAGMITPAQLVEGLRKMMSEFKRPAFTRADYAEASRKMEAMVESGEITREQMQQRLDRMRMAMGGTKSKAFTKADYKEAEKKMGAMVKAGEITKEQMQQRLGRMKQMMEQTPRFTKADYEAAVKKMTAMVKSGEITREQMEQRLSRMKQMMEQTPRFTKADYEAAAKKMTAMVKSGEITKEQMEQRLEGMKQRMQAAKSSVSTADYAKAEADMAKMVEAGTITREQMEQRLARMRALMAASEMNGRGAKKAKRALPTPPEGLSRMELREWYQRVAKRLDMAVESGRMSVDEKDAMLEKIKASLRK